MRSRVIPLGSLSGGIKCYVNSYEVPLFLSIFLERIGNEEKAKVLLQSLKVAGNVSMRYTTVHNHLDT